MLHNKGGLTVGFSIRISPTVQIGQKNSVVQWSPRRYGGSAAHGIADIADMISITRMSSCTRKFSGKSTYIFFNGNHFTPMGFTLEFRRKF